MTRGEFSISTARVGDGTYVVSATGELDLHTVDQLDTELEQALTHGAQRVVVDLAGITFMDSTALGAIVAAQRKLQLAEGELALVSDDPRIVRVFEITGLDRTIRMRPSLSEAIDELVGAAG